MFVPGEDNALLAALGLEELAGEDRKDQDSDQEPDARYENEQFVVVGSHGSSGGVTSHRDPPFEGAVSDRLSVETEEYSMIFAR